LQSRVKNYKPILHYEGTKLLVNLQQKLTFFASENAFFETMKKIKMPHWHEKKGRSCLKRVCLLNWLTHLGFKGWPLFTIKWLFPCILGMNGTCRFFIRFFFVQSLVFIGSSRIINLHYFIYFVEVKACWHQSMKNMKKGH